MRHNVFHIRKKAALMVTKICKPFKFRYGAAQQRILHSKDAPRKTLRWQNLNSHTNINPLSQLLFSTFPIIQYHRSNTFKPSTSAKPCTANKISLKGTESTIPLAPDCEASGSPWTCNLVLMTSKGHTKVAAIAPKIFQPKSSIQKKFH